jgi:hypothetical protein
MSGRSFCAYVEQFLGPTLFCGTLMIADSPRSQKATGVLKAMEVRGTSLLFLPAFQQGH